MQGQTRGDDGGVPLSVACSTDETMNIYVESARMCSLEIHVPDTTPALINRIGIL